MPTAPLPTGLSSRATSLYRELREIADSEKNDNPGWITTHEAFQIRQALKASDEPVGVKQEAVGFLVDSLDDPDDHDGYELGMWGADAERLINEGLEPQGTRE
jgi:hypothetical protein